MRRKTVIPPQNIYILLMCVNNYGLYHGAWVFRGEACKENPLSASQANELLQRGGIFVRNVYDYDCTDETSFWYIIKDVYEDLSQYSTSVRGNIRKALRTYDYKMVSVDEFIELAYPVYYEAMTNYRVKAIPNSKDLFAKDCRNRHNAEYWVGIEKASGEPAVVAVNVVTGDTYEEQVLKTRPKFMHNSSYPTYGLLHEMSRHCFQDLGLKVINIGARSFTEHSNIQNFLIHKFHYRKAYCRMRVFYKPWLRLLVCLLYPFREYIPVLKVKSLLRMEAMCRGEY